MTSFIVIMTSEFFLCTSGSPFHSTAYRLWDFDRGDNYVLQPTLSAPEEVVTSISYNFDRGCFFLDNMPYASTVNERVGPKILVCVYWPRSQASAQLLSLARAMCLHLLLKSCAFQFCKSMYM